MIANLPIWITVLFLLTFVVTIIFFYFSNGKPKLVTVLILLWSLVQSALAYNGFYLNFEAMPPRFALVLLPTILVIVFVVLSKYKSKAIEVRNTKISTFLHAIRIPVEIVLLYLFIHKTIPQLMTFEGRNFDILAGINAPIIGYLYFKNKISKKILLAWNYVGLVLVLFILINGVLSSELPFQQFAFEQPNRAVAYFPFILLPAVIVPIVIYTHLIDILKLKKEINFK